MCRMNTGEGIEEHHEFWILVASQELVWRDFAEKFDNKDTIPGDIDQKYIGKYKDSVGTVAGGKLVVAVEDKRSKSAVQKCSGLQETVIHSQDIQNDFEVLVYRQPSSLKSLCRRIIKKGMFRKNEIYKSQIMKKFLEKPDIRKYLAYKV